MTILLKIVKLSGGKLEITRVADRKIDAAAIFDPATMGVGQSLIVAMNDILQNGIKTDQEILDLWNSHDHNFTIVEMDLNQDDLVVKYMEDFYRITRDISGEMGRRYTRIKKVTPKKVNKVEYV